VAGSDELVESTRSCRDPSAAARRRRGSSVGMTMGWMLSRWGRIVAGSYKGERNPRKSLRPEGLSCSKDYGAERVAARLGRRALHRLTQKHSSFEAPFGAQGKQDKQE